MEFEEAARLRDEVKRLQQVELAIGADPMASQTEVERAAGGYAGARKYGAAANVPANRPHKPTDSEMGPHNFGGGEAGPRRGATAVPAGRSTGGQGRDAGFQGETAGIEGDGSEQKEGFMLPLAMVPNYDCTNESDVQHNVSSTPFWSIRLSLTFSKEIF